ncbi:hypothetical protein GCM10027169_32750 [Gordonia jinhuaensis]|uniref:Hydrolase of the HAD superfamily n=1 Tax=Gordonia jinhuaensis TaxID=1517702 RepID=A0A916WV76_9ACTN|nr:HAD-IA family hydrolase [Gordonia jinhuaensis]GGB33336.1 hypothetical protein GCM10011489_21890 [Gordonia jinhuaensis]
MTTPAPSDDKRIAVWTDFRGVLTPPLKSTLKHYCQHREFTPAQLNEALHAVARMHNMPDAMAVLDSGVLNEEDWLASISQELAAQFNIIDALDGFRDDWWGDRRINSDWVKQLRQLRDAGAFVGVVSNLPAEWKMPFSEALAPYEFDHIAVSCDLGFRKPDWQMFAHLSEVAGVSPAKSILVDDLTANIAGAHAVGWKAYHFTDDSADAAQFCRTVMNQEEGTL